MVKVLKFQMPFSFLFSINVEHIMAGIQKMLVRKANTEYPNQTASSVPGLLVLAFWPATSIQNIRTFTLLLKLKHQMSQTAQVAIYLLYRLFQYKPVLTYCKAAVPKLIFRTIGYVTHSFIWELQMFTGYSTFLINIYLGILVLLTN